MFYRIKQFLWAATAKLKDEDKKFATEYLNDYEESLFFSLPVFEQVHSVKVAQGVLEECLKRDAYDVLLIKAALLHDIGKINTSLNIFTISILVIMDRIFPKGMKKLIFIKSINAYYNHPEIALKYLENTDEYIAFLIRNHHNYEIVWDEKLRILQKIDSKS